MLQVRSGASCGTQRSGIGCLQRCAGKGGRIDLPGATECERRTREFGEATVPVAFEDGNRAVTSLDAMQPGSR